MTLNGLSCNTRHSLRTKVAFFFFLERIIEFVKINSQSLLEVIINKAFKKNYGGGTFIEREESKLC